MWAGERERERREVVTVAVGLCVGGGVDAALSLPQPQTHVSRGAVRLREGETERAERGWKAR